jgi:uncharacterized protein
MAVFYEKRALAARAQLTKDLGNRLAAGAPLPATDLESTKMTIPQDQAGLLERIAVALERMAPVAVSSPDFDAASGFVWQPSPGCFLPVANISRVPLELLQGIDRTSKTLLENTRRFASDLPANNALLWGARGMGKSSLVKAVHAEVANSPSPRDPSSRGEGRGEGQQRAQQQAAAPHPLPVVSTGRGDSQLKLIEIHREDISTLPACLAYLKASRLRFIVFCDDLSFDKDDTSYKSLKAVLEGGIEGRPANVIFYATSNRRHLMPREMMDNERATAINPAEATEEKVSLSDRFGLWLGFHNASQDDYIAMVRAYAKHFGLKISDAELVRDSLEWSATRGARSGRVAWQYIIDLAGRQGVALPQ